MAHQRSEQIRLRWNREFQHDSLTIGDFVKLFEQSREQEPIAFGSLRTFDIHFRLDDRDQAVLQNLPGHLELLRDQNRDSAFVRPVNDRAFLASKYAESTRALEQPVELG